MSKAALLLPLLVVLMGGASEAADLEATADLVEQAHGAGDQAALTALAAKNDPERWEVVDLLLGTARFDAAAAFAEASPDTPWIRSKLTVYVASRRDHPVREDARKRSARCILALRKQGHDVVLEATAGADLSVDDMTSVRLAYYRGRSLFALGRFGEAAASLEASGDMAERIGWERVAALAFHRALMAYHRSGQLEKAADVAARKVALAEQAGTPDELLPSLGNLAIVLRDMGEYVKSLNAYSRMRTVAIEQGNAVAAASALSGMGGAQSSLGRYDEALVSLHAAADALEALGALSAYWGAMMQIGGVHSRRGELRKAAEIHAAVLQARRTEGEPANLANALANMAAARAALGDLDGALPRYEEALGIFRARKDRTAQALTLSSIGTLHLERGELAKALLYLEQGLALCRELGFRRGLQQALANLSLVHATLGDPGRAITLQQEAGKLAEAMQDTSHVALMHSNVANWYRRLGDERAAEEHLRRALSMYEALADLEGLARVHEGLGTLHYRRGELALARKHYQQALGLTQRSSDVIGEAYATLHLAELLAAEGSYADALRMLEPALATARRIGDIELELTLVDDAALYLYRSGEHRKVLDTLHAGLAKLPLHVGRLSDTQGAMVRDRWLALTHNGVLAAAVLKDTAEIHWFVETGRAGALREALGGHAAARRAAIDPAVRTEERDARAALREARAMRSLLPRNVPLARRRAAAKRVTAAEAILLGVLDRAQVEARAQGAVVDTGVGTLVEVQASLAETEALVTFLDYANSLVAFVVTKRGARFAEFSKAQAIAAALAQLEREDPGAPPAAALEALRIALMPPLQLPDGIRRLLIAPAGPLAYVPFAMLAPEYEVAYVPSGTTLRALRARKAVPSKHILALGDPDYGVPPDPQAAALLRGARTLVPLPATRAEAQAIGDEVLLGGKATARGLLEALGTRPRWRAVHLACHGLLDAERPMLCALALTGSTLSVHDVMRADIPADLVVLSACDTGRGKLHRAEGVVGFTRAFMMAGASRVLVSLWKVDDEATRALMTRFYELWQGAGGADGLDAATALRQAQAHVRKQPKWSQISYWAAWQLWGLP